jgi:hypothetical protein
MYEGQAGHQHAMTIGNAGSQHREERSWWAQGPTCLKQLQEWKQWVQHCHTTGDSNAPACITIANGLLSMKAEGGQRLFKLDMGTGNVLESTSDEPVKTEPRAQDETLHHEGAKQENRSQETWPFTECKTWHDSSANRDFTPFCVTTKRSDPQSLRARKSQSLWSPRARRSNDGNWSVSAHTAGVSRINTTVRTQTWTYPSSSNSIPHR